MRLPAVLARGQNILIRSEATTRRVSISNRHPGLRFDRRAVTALIRTLDAQAEKFLGGCPPGELSIAFLTDAGLARIHADFLADPNITDVITFSGNRAHGLGGEICVSADAALRQSGKENLGRELALYIVHGWLHLAGYDDLTPAKKRTMRAAERRAMKLLAASHCEPQFRLLPQKKS